MPEITVSHGEKTFFPDAGITKEQVVEYYRRVGPAMLPGLADRPLTVQRFPDGIAGKGWLQKSAAPHYPDWIATVEVDRKSGDGTTDYVLCQDTDTLLYLADQAAIEFHVWTSTTAELTRPDRLVIDLDPGDGIALAAIKGAARRCRDAFTELGLAPYIQATGGRGYHVVAPLDGTGTFELVRPLAHAIARRIAASDPERLTTRQRKDARGHRIFLDANRNAFAQTFVAPYSLRARRASPAATPLQFSELSRSRPNGYTMQKVTRRLAHKKDPWADMPSRAVSAHEVAECLGASPAG
jgi:bifunctional non-homologous end joining protein LigD